MQNTDISVAATIVALVVIAAVYLLLPGCATRYQPPGENIWRAL